MRAYPSQVSPQLTYFSRHGGSVGLARTGPPETLVGASLFVSELRLLYSGCCYKLAPSRL